MGLLSLCTPQELVDIRAACEADLLTHAAIMLKARLNMDFQVNWHHEVIADALMAVARGEIPNLVINMPPGGGKTELGVIQFITWCLARNPRCRFLHLSYSDDLALLNSATAKETVGLEEFRLLWPYDIRQDSRAKKRWNLEINGRAAGGVYATSTGGQVTGFRAGFMTEEFSGALIIDDPLKPEDAWSKAKLETAKRKLTNTIRSRRATDNTPVILIMQRLHEDDPSALALRGDMGIDFEHLEIQALIQDPETGEERSYWQEKESLESLAALREKDPYTFASQYQQQPTPPGGNMIKTVWIQRYTVQPKITAAGIFVDTAEKTGMHNDWTVLLYAGTDGHNLYALDLLRERLEAPDLLKQALAFWEKHRPHRITNPVRFTGFFVEDKSAGTGLIQHLKRAKKGIPVIALQRDADKVSRVNDVLPYIKAGQLWVPEHAPWAKEYINELGAFSPAMTHRHDDQVDVTVDAINELLSPGGGNVHDGDWS